MREKNRETERLWAEAEKLAGEKEDELSKSRPSCKRPISATRVLHMPKIKKIRDSVE